MLRKNVYDNEVEVSSFFALKQPYFVLGPFFKAFKEFPFG